MYQRGSTCHQIEKLRSWHLIVSPAQKVQVFLAEQSETPVPAGLSAIILACPTQRNERSET